MPTPLLFGIGRALSPLLLVFSLTGWMLGGCAGASDASETAASDISTQAGYFPTVQPSLPASAFPTSLADPPADGGTSADVPDADLSLRDAAPATPSLPPVRTAGCGRRVKRLAGASYAVAGGRTYHVWAPASYDPNRAYPILMMFHGLGMTGTSFEAYFQMESYVDGGAIVVYPDAINGVWDYRGAGDFKFVDDVLAKVESDYCGDATQVMGFGFSLGGYFANHLGCVHSSAYRAMAIGEAGFSSDSGAKCRTLPIFYTHRTTDNNESIAGGRAGAARWSSENGCSKVTKPVGKVGCVAYQGCRAPVEFCEDHSSMTGIPGYQPDWEHTVRENLRQAAWDWFKTL